ncbi:MAG: oxidoreductase [Cycloclasticus sp.]|nr:MAG: oxidoreductase [Cycloclasticus sp.]
MTLIKHKKLSRDDWQYLKEGGELRASNNIVNLDYWRGNNAVLVSEHSPCGILIHGDENPESFVADLDKLSLIAIDMPSFADGRAYSLAKVLRDTYGFTKEIRAMGDILPDQALYLTRVGFDALEFANETSATLAIEKLSDFSVFYQPQLSSQA